MSMRKQRFLQELYNVTPTRSQPKITPVLRGIYRMQGPVHEAEYDFSTNMVPSQLDKEYNSCSKNLKSGLRAESGTCNVCPAPCSSCFHINQQLMESKTDECSGETCAGYASNASVDDAAVPNDKILKFETDKRKLDSGNSSNCSENICSEGSLRNSGLSAAFQDVALLKLDEPKGKGCPDDMSSVTGTEDVKLSNVNASNGVRKDPPSYAASGGTSTLPEDGKVFSQPTSVSICSLTDLSMKTSRLGEAVRENSADAACLLNDKDGSSEPTCGKPCDPNLKDTEESLCSSFCGDLEVPRDQLDSLLRKEVIPDVVHSDMAVGASQATDKVVGSCLCPVAKGNDLESHMSDDSDLVEHDVKVCDICGDAGREDLLAICSRCSDGAEHTYCMKEMLAKVPEGEWLCEECKFDVAIENDKQDIVGSANEKSSSGMENPENTNSSVKSERKGSNDEGNKASKDHSGGKISLKRHIEDSEVSSSTKKRLLDPNVGPTKTSGSNAGIALSRESSFKQLDRGKIKPTQQSSSCTLVARESADSPALSSRLQTSQGNFIKSNSFNSSNMKPKVKLVDDVVPQKQRPDRELVSLNKKEGTARPISKSVSFKYGNSGRVSGNELNMLSSKFPAIQDVKGLKHTKDQSLFERKNSFNAEHTSVSSPTTTNNLTGKIDKRLASGADAGSLSSVRSHRDTKAVQSDSKSITFSRSSSFAVRKGSEMPVSLGEVKKQSSQLASVVSSVNGNSSSDMKSKPSSPKEDSSSSSCIAERPLSNADNDRLLDGLSGLKESTSFCERRKESSVSRSKQSSASGRTIACQKCNEFGHLTQHCAADLPGSPASDSSAAKNSRGISEVKDKLKAAIEAAVLRKPEIYRKHRVLDPSDDVSLSSTNTEIAPQDHVLNSCVRGNASATEEMFNGQIIPDSDVDSCKQITVDNVKQSEMLRDEGLASRIGDACRGIATQGLSLVGDTLSQVQAEMSLHQKTLAIPDYEYIWQGNFEVSRYGNTLRFCDGIQAHLSSCASPRVLQAVNKFPLKIVLNELPRLSTWPRQFQEYGVKEDNIALFFFAKDLLSYEKSYKILLDNMMKNDLALRGNLDDVELMIFPSNQLPEKSQRWNTLFFLWGVFWGKRADSLENELRSQKQIHLAQDIPKAIMSLPENICSLRPIDKDLTECGKSASAFEGPAPRDLHSLSSSQTLDEDCDTRVSLQVIPDDHMQMLVEKRDDRVDSGSFLVVQSSNMQSCEDNNTSISREEMQRICTSLEGGVEPAGKLEHGVCSGEATARTAGFGKCEQMVKDEDSSPNGQKHSLHLLEESKVGGQKSLVETTSSHCQVETEDGSVLDSSLSGTMDRIVQGNRKRHHIETVERILESSSASTSQAIPGNGASEKLLHEVHTIKRLKTSFCGVYGSSQQTSSPIEGCVSGIQNLASGSPFETDCRAEGFDGADVHAIEGNAERYFFPVGPHPEEIDINKAAESCPWKLNPLEDDRLHEKAPNLELALGAETKPMAQGIPSFLLGKEDKNYMKDHPSQGGASKGEEDDESASLSLSLSFPFPDEEQRGKSVSATERRHVNTSLLLFGGSKDE